jgi:hypothetical protein
VGETYFATYSRKVSPDSNHCLITVGSTRAESIL